MRELILSPLRWLATRYPYACAVLLFIAAMTFVKFGAVWIVDGYGLPGTLLAIGTIFVFATIIDRR